ncbi:MAG TPA: extracellular solute-binding protein [Chloroflexota bacterium]|nr:extracellular solute-binding protein [Chloroflexota bacterium]
MSDQSISRRKLLKSLGVLGIAVPLLQACGGTPTPAVAPTTAATTSGTTATQAPQGQAAPAGGKIALSIATYAGLPDEWQREAAKTWMAKNPDVALTIDEINYADMPKKQLAELATGTMQDAVFSGIKWFPYSAAKGAFRPIDDYVKANDPGMSDFFSAALAGASFEGKLYGLPYLMHPGNNALIAYNKDMLAEKSVTPPTDDWSVDDYVKLTTTMTDAKNKIWGSNYFPNSYYDFCSLARTWGGDDLSQDGKKFTFATDPKSVAAAQWAVDLRSKYAVTPSRAESPNEGTMFPAKQLATSTAGTYSILGLGKTVGDKFKWDVVLFPKGPTGIRGYQGFVELFSIFIKSKQPEKAFDLLVAESSKETQIMAVVKYAYQPGSRKSVWSAPEITKISSIFGRALTWMSDTPGPFPMPYNLRFSELEDKWENTSKTLFYGEEGFQTGLQAVQQACQTIMDEPRP